ncbi:MAG TPA: HEAT repeat domain-containing protein [Planctomycetota bacterium]|jgi:HEAT repeat protein|nr:HEAT repeat domain-containing protein [Planctomycetota bacterium]
MNDPSVSKDGAAAAQGPAAEGGGGEGFARSILPLFVTPLVIIGPLVVLSAAFLLLFVARERTPGENLERVLNGGANERWQAAFELQRQLQDPGAAGELDAAFLGRLLGAYEKARDDDPRVREFLGSALGGLRSARAVPALLATLEDAPSDDSGRVRLAALRALAAIGDDAAVAPIARVLRGDADRGLRMGAANALGSLPGEESVAALLAGLRDGEVQVRWNAALALAAHGRREGVPHLLEMLERANLSFFTGPRVEDLREEAVVSAIRALARLRVAEAAPRIEALARSDPNPRVQNEALRAQRELRGN